MANILPGNLGALPLELGWMTLDELLTESSVLGHDSFCSIRKLGQTDEQAAATIDAYFSREKTAKLIRQAIEADGCFTYSNALQARADSSDLFKVPPFGVPQHFSACKMAAGLVTGIIKDGCVGCFEKIRTVMPEIDGTYVNNRGWLYLAVAVSSESMGMIKYFCAIDSPVSNTPLLMLLTRPANVLYNNITSRTVLENIALKKKFGRDMFAFLLPWFEEMTALAFGGRLAKDLLQLCRFLTPVLAVEFEKVGMPLHNVRDAPNGGNAYHAAAVNSTEFLNFLSERSTLSMQVREGNARNGALPIHHAIRANLVGCVIWFQKNGGADGYDPQVRPWTTGTTADLASRITTDESVEMLKEILAPLEHQRASLGPYFCLGLLTGLTDGLRSHDYGESRGLTAQELADLKNQDEERAIKKATLILAFASGSIQTPGVEDGWKKAVSDAQGLGFDKLADCIEAAAPRD